MINKRGLKENYQESNNSTEIGSSRQGTEIGMFKTNY